MKKTLGIILICTIPFLVGCEDHPREWVAWGNVIPENKKAEAAKWIIEIVAAANPKSDEEPEDNILQAEHTMFRLFGIKTVGIKTVSGFVPYKLCSPRMQRMCDAYLGGRN